MGLRKAAQMARVLTRRGSMAGAGRGGYRPVIAVMALASAAALLYAAKARYELSCYSHELAGNEVRALSLQERLASKERRLETVLTRLENEAAAKKEYKNRLDSILEEKSGLETKLQEYADRLSRGEPEVIIITKEYVRSGPTSALSTDLAVGAEGARGGASDGRIVDVDREGPFVAVDLGSRDGVKLADIFSVYRDNRFVGSIRADRIEQDRTIAYILPSWQHVEFMADDEVEKR